MLVNLSVDLHVREWPWQHKEVDSQWVLCLGLKSDLKHRNHLVKSKLDIKLLKVHLISDLSVIALMNVALRIVDDCFNDPLVVERREAGGFVEQFMNVFIRPIRFHL